MSKHTKTKMNVTVFETVFELCWHTERGGFRLSAE